jgi:hypothetical protein
MTKYTDLVAEIKTWADRADLSDALVQSWITDAEASMDDDLRVGEMIKTTQIALSTNALAMPADFIQSDYLRFVPNPANQNPYIVNGAPIHWVSRDEYYTIVNNPYHVNYNKPFFTVICNQSLLINPQFFSTVPVNVELSYYSQVPALATNDNSIIYSHYERIYRYAALAASASYLTEDDRVPIWESKAIALIQKANETWIAAKADGGPLNIRFRSFG